jgi:hypothetical protein
LFLFGFRAGICLESGFFSFLLMHHISIFSSFHLFTFSPLHLFIFSYLHIFKIHRVYIMSVASGRCFIEQQGV